MAPFHAVLVISFGGPQGLDDIRPFLANVLRGRRISANRVEEVAHHYEMFGGVSPLTEYTMRQAEGLRARLAATGEALPVFVGMRNWHPFLTDTMAEMSRAGVRRAIGFITAAHSSYSSCEQYRENVRDAREALRKSGLADIGVTYVESWHTHRFFIETNARHVAEALAALPPDLQPEARLIFTAHSIPLSQAEQTHYREQLMASCVSVAASAGRTDWALIYQSRSGRPEDAWLEPDIVQYLKAARAEGLRAAVLCPIGFLCDHIEVLYDLDHDAAAAARDVGLAMTRAAAVNDDPQFLDMMADVVLRTRRRYATGRAVPLAHQNGKPNDPTLSVAQPTS